MRIMIVTAQEIVRCIRRDYGTSIADLQAGARYCETIARNASFNPWASPETAPAYSEAANTLKAQAEQRQLDLAAVEAYL